MKKLMISMLAMATMVSCTNEIETPDQPINDGNVEIQLNAGIAATTKAPVPSTLKNDLAVLFLRAADGSTTADWATTPTTIKAVISKEDGNPITFKKEDGTTDQKLYYPTAGSNAHLAGYYIDNATVSGSTNVLTLSIDGQQDIMATKGQSASSSTQFKTFEFQHLLSQVKIQLVGEAAAQTAFGKIKKVDIVSPTNLTLTLGSSDPAIALGENNTDKTINVYTADNDGTDLTSTATLIGDIVMIYNGGDNAYGTSGNELKLKITSEKAGEVEVPVTISTTGLVVSHSHEITLTFKDRITANATIGTWETGSAGSGEVE